MKFIFIMSILINIQPHKLVEIRTNTSHYDLILAELQYRKGKTKSITFTKCKYIF